MMSLFRTSLLAALLTCMVSFPAVAAFSDDDDDQAEKPVPMDLYSLENLEGKKPDKKDEEKEGLPFNIRKAAIKDAAMSYGARGGLAMRTYQIRQMLDANSAYLDKVFNFRELLIPAPSGLLIEPPVISEDEKALIINDNGQEAAVADRIYNINKNAKIVTAPRMWRNYLERDWGELTPPPDILLPQTDEERDAWVENVRKGWKKGMEQADEIYQDDLNQLTAHYQGMVRYRMLLAQKMVSPPYAVQTDRGVTGGGKQMRIGDRAVQITGVPQLQPESEQWQPANR